ncbi:hypothetical protein NDU88_005981 [Pleurodeles waltl]|uniref:Uncharacterized protein n=1 Tax=Pleurodeles waltl TaxID=8319 RepID=A0AAV7UKT9_PLEWA|nr:hypothetical protein NDU88_005981 [Pleurodeles waltl]
MSARVHIWTSSKEDMDRAGESEEWLWQDSSSAISTAHSLAACSSIGLLWENHSTATSDGDTCTAFLQYLRLTGRRRDPLGLQSFPGLSWCHEEKSGARVKDLQFNWEKRGVMQAHLSKLTLDLHEEAMLGLYRCGVVRVYVHKTVHSLLLGTLPVIRDHDN